MDQENFKNYFPEYCENIRMFHFSNWIKSQYQLGIWLFEPDEIVWHNTRDNYIGLIEREPNRGYLRGILGVPLTLTEQDLADLESYRPVTKIKREMFYFPRKDEMEMTTWVEFSCDGPQDYCPGDNQFSMAHPDKHYRDIYFVSGEIKLIGLQLKEKIDEFNNRQ